MRNRHPSKQEEAVIEKFIFPQALETITNPNSIGESVALQINFVQFDLFRLFLIGLVVTVVIAIIGFIVVISLPRMLQKSTQTQLEEPTAIVREREIIKEIVKIRCPYCNNLYDEKYDKCPHCGGKRKT